MDKLVAFVAHSFDPKDEQKLEPILRFLDSLRGVGFVWQRAERAEVESVSTKVRRMIDDSDVFVGILTARHPSYRIKGGIKDAFKVLWGRLAPVTWTAPPWIVQESGYALKGGKHLILFREPEVEIPGLQADLEYIEYIWSDPSIAFRRVNEMLVGLIGKRAGVAVETVVNTSPASTDQAPQPPTTAMEPQESVADEMDIGQCHLEMTIAFEAKDLERAGEHYERGLALVKEQRPDLELNWQAIYQRQRFATGQADALEELKRLQAANPANAFIAGSIGMCFAVFDENEDAASQFKIAASLAKEGLAVDYSVRAANHFKKAKRHKDAEQILLESLLQAPSDKRGNILQSLYEVLTDEGETYQASGIAEFALHENPGQHSLRFDVGLNYHRAGLQELFLYHFKLLTERDPLNSGALHNLALAYSECELPILSASHYKRAFELGNTLAANNLGFKYLDCGFADEAAGLLREALDEENCAPEVSNCLAAVEQRRVDETKIENSKTEETKKHREFLISLGRGYLSPATPPLEGKWKFHFAELDFKFALGKLEGAGQTTVEIEEPRLDLSGLGGLSGGPKDTSPKRTKTEKFRFSGEVVGRACKFVIEKTVPLNRLAFALLGGNSSDTEGFIVFAEDGRSAEVLELKEKKPQEYYGISKIQP